MSEEKTVTKEQKAKDVLTSKVKKASQDNMSTDPIGFKCEKSHNGMVVGKIYKVSENVADILVARELGQKVELPAKKKK